MVVGSSTVGKAVELILGRVKKMLKEMGVFTFLLAFLLIVIAFYIGFSWDVLAFTGAATRVTKELMTGVGGVNTYPQSGQSSQPTSLSVTNV
jgi:hypothetical protein